VSQMPPVEVQKGKAIENKMKDRGVEEYEKSANGMRQTHPLDTQLIIGKKVEKDLGTDEKRPAQIHSECPTATTLPTPGKAKEG